MKIFTSFFLKSTKSRSKTCRTKILSISLHERLLSFHYEQLYILDRMRFFAHHGVGRQETLVGNEFVVSLRLKVDIGHAMQTDDVTDTVSYAEVYEAVKKEMEIPSKLLEHVGGRIVKRLFGDFPPIEDIELKLSKRNPPMGADIEAAGIEIHTSRQQQ